MLKRKFLGQNFLKNKRFLKLIAESLEIKEDDLIVEIGGGHGELTQFLTKAKKVTVYELDQGLADFLKQKFSSYHNVEIMNQDFLKADLAKYHHNYKIAGNIPYSITGLIIRKILNKNNFPQITVLTVQKEVGEKIVKEGNFLNFWIKIWGDPQKIAVIKKTNFKPQPKVDSMIVKIRFYSQPLVTEPENFASFLKKIFKEPKKMLKKKLKLPSGFEHLANRRPHELNFEEILSLYREIKKLGS